MRVEFEGGLQAGKRDNKNGDGSEQGEFLHFYVATTIPQMPLSKVDGVVACGNHIFRAEGKRETLGPHWELHKNVMLKFKFSGHAARCVCSQPRSAFLCHHRKCMMKMIPKAYLEARERSERHT